MDTTVPRKNRKKQYIALSLLAFFLLAALGIYLANRPRTLHVKRAEILIKKVKKDNFEDFVVFQAQVDPLHSLLVNVIEGGSVQELYVENGAMVTQGTPLARLYNPNTEFNYLAQETGIIEQINQLNVAKLNLRNQELELSKELVLIEHDYNSAQMEYQLNNKLYDRKILAKNEYEVTAEKLRYQKERKNIIQNSIQRERETNALQIRQINQALGIMEKSLETLRNNKKNFLVTAPATGRLSSFEATLGLNILAGTAIGKIDVMKGYKLTANVDEFYLDKINTGQTGTIEVKEESQEVRVTKILPEIKNGQFKIELEFLGAQPQGLQVGLSFGVKLILSGAMQKLVIPKGSFSSVTQGNWIFVVENGIATKRKIELGRENPVYYEVRTGLKEGEEIIVSNYEDYKHVEKLELK
ncbi:efflux RND transporter periplasmic adaptor subunit [Sphingobacterium psychroaquaticum]|uniref:efflux RND transporter periplasmic adaptor subunit n=1 Tax=Sphingobacterium psychroaquaticum TaxID=561061 RepID=UPI00106B1E4D|nr:efflux RND transporter periplasmic adaptor subunit [Sphingobacterium psychroaquaticum]QBQ40854.1 efflux RND transporter periplasmic adaptor subunit [Sphingobacterium psychroaquaticum]